MASSLICLGEENDADYPENPPSGNTTSSEGRISAPSNVPGGEVQPKVLALAGLLADPAGGVAGDLWWVFDLREGCGEFALGCGVDVFPGCDVFFESDAVARDDSCACVLDESRQVIGELVEGDARRFHDRKAVCLHNVVCRPAREASVHADGHLRRCLLCLRALHLGPAFVQKKCFLRLRGVGTDAGTAKAVPRAQGDEEPALAERVLEGEHAFVLEDLVVLCWCLDGAHPLADHGQCIFRDGHGGRGGGGVVYACGGVFAKVWCSLAGIWCVGGGGSLRHS